MIRIPPGQRGASGVEYGVLIAGIAMVIALGVYSCGGAVRSALFDTACTTIASNVSTSASVDCG
jgi:Flp pilus assembly pilin Flp